MDGTWKRDLLDYLSIVGGNATRHQYEFVVLADGVGTEEHHAALFQVFVGDLQSHNAGVEIAHFHQVGGVDANVAESANTGHDMPPLRASKRV